MSRRAALLGFSPLENIVEYTLFSATDMGASLSVEFFRKHPDGQLTPLSLADVCAARKLRKQRATTAEREQTRIAMAKEIARRRRRFEEHYAGEMPPDEIKLLSNWYLSLGASDQWWEETP